MDVSLLGPMEDEKMKDDAAAPVKFKWVATWALNTCFNFCIISLLYNTMPNLESLTPSQAAAAVAIQRSGMLWCSVAGAGPAALALLLDGRSRIRLAFAYAGLASAVANHCMGAWIMGLILVTAQQGDHFLFLASLAAAEVAVLAVVDLKGFLALLRSAEQAGRQLGK